MAKWGVEETLKFIEMYQNETCIWDPKNKHHKDKNKVNDSWDRIADGMGIPIIELKKKKETLMTAFRSNFKKKQMSIIRGDAEIYNPIWIFYDPMEHFLKDIYDCKSMFNPEMEVSKKKERPVVYLENADEESDDDWTQKLSPGPSHKKRRKVNPVDTKPMIPVRNLRSTSSPELEDVNSKMNTSYTTFNEAPSRSNRDESEDECVLYGKLITIKLKQFSQDQRNELMYEIDGIIMKKRQMMNSNSNIPNSSMPSPQNSTSHWSMSVPNQDSDDY